MSWEGFINCHYSIYEQTAFNRYGKRLEKFIDYHSGKAVDMIPDEAIDMTDPNTMELSITNLSVFVLDVMIDLAENMLI